MRRPLSRWIVVILVAGCSAVASARVDSARVVAVHDGDTITVRVGGQIEKVRLVGIDAPELNDGRPPYQQVAVEARDAARTLLKGKTVTLETDLLQKDRDQYQRLLRYVILGDGTNANEWLVRHGLARVYNRFEFAKKEMFRADELAAKRDTLGIWALPPGPARVTPRE